MRDKFLELLNKELRQNEKTILLTADLGFGIFDRFNDLRNKQYFNVGVCEQLMASMSAGFSLEGYKVFNYSIGVFPTLRCLEQIRNDISYHESKVTIVTSGAGFSYGALGMSHHCVEDIGFVSSIPGLEIYSPANVCELEDSYYAESNLKYLRIDKSNFSLERLDKVNEYINLYYLGNSNIDSKVLVLAHGSIAEICKPIVNSSQENFDLYTITTLKDSLELKKLLSSYSKVITIEEHTIKNGFFSFIANIVIINNLKVQIIPMALSHEFCSIVGSQDYLREINGLTTNNLKKLL